MEKALIVAISDDNAIGRGGDMPWHLPDDLKYFKRVTLGCPVIMGRRTFESIGRPLPGRKNIVISRRGGLPEGVTVVDSISAAYEAALPADRCFVMGGGSVYSEVIDDMDLLYVTHIHTQIPDADVYFPEINADIWRVISKSEEFVNAGSGLHFEFVVYGRR